jgi:hypothetical protein
MNFYSGKFLRPSLANGSTVLESTFKYAELARPFKYTDGTGVSYYLQGVAVSHVSPESFDVTVPVVSPARMESARHKESYILKQ